MCLLLAWFNKNHSAVWLVCCAESAHIGLQHLAVDFGFALECQGIGAAAWACDTGAWALVESEVDPSAYGWFAQPKCWQSVVVAFCPVVTTARIGATGARGRHVGFLNNFKKIFGGIVLQTVDCGGGVVEGDAYVAQKCFDLGLAEFTWAVSTKS